MENLYESETDRTLYEILYNWTKDSLISELISIMTEDEKMDIVQD